MVFHHGLLGSAALSVRLLEGSERLDEKDRGDVREEECLKHDALVDREALQGGLVEDKDWASAHVLPRYVDALMKRTSRKSTSGGPVGPSRHFFSSRSSITNEASDVR